MKKTENLIADIITQIILLFGFTNIVSGVMWTFSDTPDKWFSRFFLGIILLGIYAIIVKLDNLKNDKTDS